MGQALQDGGFILDQPNEIQAFRLLAMKSRLKLEVQSGMNWSSRGPTTANIVRAEINSTTRSKAKLLVELETYLREKGILRDEQDNTASNN